jgi:hypothetical protein
LRKHWIIWLFVGQFAIAQVDKNQRITIDFEGTLIDFFQELEKKTSVKFAFKHQDIEQIKGHWIFKKKSLAFILDVLSDSYQLKFENEDNQQIFLRKNEEIYTVRGFVKNATNNERIIGAMIVSDDGKVVHTDDNGYFLISNESRKGFAIVADGYQYLYVNNENISKSKYTVFYVKPVLEFVEVIIKPKYNALRFLHKTEEIVPKIAEKIPIVGGEVDFLQGLRTLGGIKPALGNSQGWSVRGVKPQNNLIMIDGMPVYHSMHLLGVVSIFNAPNINQIQVHKDIQSSTFGGRVGSLISLSLNDGNKEKWTAMADAGIISTGISLNGPLIKNKLSMSLSARRSHFDWLSDPALRVISQNEFTRKASQLRFYSIFGKFHFKINDKSNLRLSVHNGGDLVSFGSEVRLFDTLNSRELNRVRLSWNNFVVSAAFDYRLSDKWSLNINSGYSVTNYNYIDQYRLRNDLGQDINQSERESGLEEFRNSIRLKYVQKGHQFSGGVGANHTLLTPSKNRFIRENVLTFLDTVFNLQFSQLNEYFVFLEDYIDLKQFGKILIGVRGVNYDIQSNQSNAILEPRFSWSRPMDSTTVIRFNYMRLSQALNAVSSSNFGIPHPVWFSLQGLKPIISDQFSVNLLAETKLGVWRINAFYRLDQSLYQPKPGQNAVYAIQDPENLFYEGSGIAYGLEFQLNFTLRKWALIPVYSYIRSTEQNVLINNGNRFYSSFDGPHIFNLLLNYEISKSANVSFNFQYFSGSPITLPDNRYVSTLNGAPVVLNEYRSVNNFRMVASHQLDVQYSKTFTKEKYAHHLTLGLFNMYSQINPYMTFIGLNEKGDQALKIRSFLPSLPIVKYAISF